jgi:ABC-type dipeptide/oligopeptide/nickel transport system ATPase component
MPLLEVENLQTHFFTQDGVVKAVDGVTLHINEGETLGIVVVGRALLRSP